MESKIDRVSQLIQLYLQNKLTAAEYSEMWELLSENLEENSFQEEFQMLWQKAKNEQALIAAEEWDTKMRTLKEKLKVAVPDAPVQPKVIRFNKYRWAAAAVFFIFISSAIYFLATTNSKDDSDIVKSEISKEQVNDMLPGGDKALLTLADGSQIVLDSAGNGLLAQQGKTNIIKQQDGQLIYNSLGTETDVVSMNMLATPRGGQYKLVLPDGSKVWLNAASSLQYPTAFTGKDRIVDITGEAYFEVAKDASRPFKVRVNEMEVEVLGTAFNINGYVDEAATKTTLLEGSVKINTKNGTSLLKPGQQAQMQKTGKIKLVDDADLEETMAWKDGNFQFENNDIQTVMRQLARWYDVDVEYRGTVSKHFIGSISRNVNLSQVLSMLQQTGEVKFKIEGRKVIVMP